MQMTLLFAAWWLKWLATTDGPLYIAICTLYTLGGHHIYLIDL